MVQKVRRSLLRFEKFSIFTQIFLKLCGIKSKWSLARRATWKRVSGNLLGTLVGRLLIEGKQDDG